LSSRKKRNKKSGKRKGVAERREINRGRFSVFPFIRRVNDLEVLNAGVVQDWKENLSCEGGWDEGWPRLLRGTIVNDHQKSMYEEWGIKDDGII